MDPEILAIVMLFVGLALLIAEVFVPSGGMITILAVVCIAVSIWAAQQAWWETARGIWWSYLAALLLLAPSSIAGSLYMLQRTELGRHILLDAPSLDEVTPYAEDEERLSKLLGRFGKTLTLLNPGGMLLVDGERLHCESQGMMIDPGEDVEIVAMQGNRLVVRRVEAKPSDDTNAQQQLTSEAAADDDESFEDIFDSN